jgi:hypothetical protein
MTGALWWKDSAKVLPCLQFARWWNSLLTRSCNSKSNLCLSRIFVVRFRGEKKCERMQTVILMFFFFWFFTLEYIWYTKFWAASKKNPTSCMFGSPFACARIFFSPRNRASKMRERHQLFFGLRLLVSKEFRHLANKNRAALWRTLKFWNPSHATVPFSKKSSPFYEMKNLFFLQIYS